MAADAEPDIRLEIGHVLLIDIVGYSKLLITEQRRQLQTLQKTVRNTAQFRASEAGGTLVRIPTGDGIALIFRDSVEAPVRCALEISQALGSQPEIQIRMGIHSGPVSEVIDVNERTNIAGAGIDIAQRVMDCGDAGHILLSEHVADDLAPYPRWNPYLHDLGGCEVKHGRKIFVVNLYTETAGNSQMPEKFKQGQQEQAAAMRSATSAPAAPSAPSPVAPSIPKKSIAVLPFENLSEDKANAYFASGMGNEVLTKLAQLPELKLISRASTERYQSHPDLKTVGRELGVASILEGSVQKAGDEVLISVRLIDARSDNQLWAQGYRRTLKNIFDVEAEVAEKVAEALKVKLAPAEAKRLAAPATTNPRAHDLYLRARALGAHSDEQSLVQAIALLRQALMEDQHFALAWAHLAWAYLLIMDAYRAPLEFLAPAQHAALMAVASDERGAAGHIFLGAIALIFNWDFSVAKHELERAVALDPNSSDASGWHAWYLARVERDFGAARAEVERALTLDPFYSWLVWAGVTVAIAQGDYEAAMQFAERILTIDPHFLYDEDPIGHVYVAMGRWQDGVKRYESLPASTLGGPNFELAVCYAHTGESARAKQILSQIEARAQHRYVDRTHIAAIHAALGDKDKAFAELDQALQSRSARISAPRFYPWLAPLFDDPRFAALEDKINHSAIALPEDWMAER
jgi:adenylate cyclase